MPIIINARPRYTKRDVPTDPKQLIGWLPTELGNIARAFIPTQSRSVLVSGRVQSTDTILYVDATAGPITLTLPSPDQVKDLVVTIKKVDAINVITLIGTVDGATNPTLTAQYQAMTIGSDGSQYHLLSQI